MIMQRFVINLDSRPDRLAAFKAVCPFDDVVRWPASIPVLVPDWWRSQPGAFGCYLSHMKLLQYCILQRYDVVTIFEDDAIPCEDFVARYDAFIAALPDDWQWVYLGGQHLDCVEVVNKSVRRGTNINRMHAYMLKRSRMLSLYEQLRSEIPWTTSHHIDHYLGALHKHERVYSPATWLFGQAQGVSDVNGYELEKRFF